MADILSVVGSADEMVNWVWMSVAMWLTLFAAQIRKQVGRETR